MNRCTVPLEKQGMHEKSKQDPAEKHTSLPKQDPAAYDATSMGHRDWANTSPRALDVDVAPPLL